MAVRGDDGRVLMQSDSAYTSDDGRRFICSNPKVAAIEGEDGLRVLVGAAGTVSVGQAILYGLSVPAAPTLPHRKWPINKFCDCEGCQDAWLVWMVTQMVPALDLALGDEIALTAEDLLLVVAGGRMYVIDEELAAFESGNAFEAIGSGEESAIAAMTTLCWSEDEFSLDPWVNNPQRYACMAMRVASERRADVAGPFHTHWSVDET